MPIGHQYVFFGKRKISLKILLSIFKLDCCLYVVELYKLYKFWLHSLSHIRFTNVFSHSIGYLYFIDGFFCSRSFLVWCSNVCLFLLLFPFSEETSKKVLLMLRVKYVLSMFPSRKPLMHFELIVAYSTSGLVSFCCMWLSTFHNIVYLRDFPFFVVCSWLLCHIYFNDE